MFRLGTKSTMKWLYALLILLCSISTTCFAQSKETRNIVIDGNLSDWAPDTLALKDAKNYLEYDVTNDHEFLYVSLKRRFQPTKVAMSGRIVIEVDGKDISKSSLQITYPFTPTYTSTLWEFMLIKNLQARSLDTVAIYNDYGIIAGGDLNLVLPPGASKSDMAAFRYGFSAEGVKGVGFCEIGIPLKYISKENGKVKIRITIAGDANSSYAATMANALRSMNANPDLVKDQFTESITNIDYTLKY
ncbi:hypothetical protein LX64_01652 [Chitinophaga skermanii]|uniref:Uncharacterized protein n=1 Tax=Chitinophaga skermanii TaxID=331697 RepID=A0A327QRK0_9BACT|nr:hypothetical protein [Chitinophaga skermanii]RAJ06525.1 hypothetical protein LX64_01652 [Chitinophaga skermanii]